jgi:hypothetical protein
MSKLPIFQSVFGVPWADLPLVLQKHYAIRAYSRDCVVAEGTMTIRRGWITRLLSPFLTAFGALVPCDGENIPTTVRFYSGPESSAFHFDRVFHFPGRAPFRFLSRLEPVAGAEMIEFMRFGIGWRCRYHIDGVRADRVRVILSHVGYVVKIHRWLIPLPLVWILGKGAAEEEALTEDRFKMWMTITHPIWGEIYRYEGGFQITAVTCE